MTETAYCFYMQEPLDKQESGERTTAINFQGQQLLVSTLDLKKAVETADLGLQATVDKQSRSYTAGATTCPIFAWMMDVDPYFAKGWYLKFLKEHVAQSVSLSFGTFPIRQEKVGVTVKFWLALAVGAEIYKSDGKEFDAFCIDHELNTQRMEPFRALGRKLQSVGLYAEKIGEFPDFLSTMPRQFKTSSPVEYVLKALKPKKQKSLEAAYYLLCNPKFTHLGRVQNFADLGVDEARYIVNEVFKKNEEPQRDNDGGENVQNKPDGDGNSSQPGTRFKEQSKAKTERNSQDDPLEKLLAERDKLTNSFFENTKSIDQLLKRDGLEAKHMQSFTQTLEDTTNIIHMLRWKGEKWIKYMK